MSKLNTLDELASKNTMVALKYKIIIKKKTFNLKKIKGKKTQLNEWFQYTLPYQTT